MATFSIEDLKNNVDTDAALSRPLTAWRPLLAQECQVFVFGEQYIAKRFDQINFVFCDKSAAKDILVDNLYALLRFKYFKQLNEEVDARINDIVKSFTANLKTTLKKITVDKNSDGDYTQFLPAHCLAFKNGVFDFLHNRWLFKYEITRMKDLNNCLYMYDFNYIVLWYFNFDFDPLDIDITKTNLLDFVDLMKDLTKVQRNYCFELIYNMSHDNLDEFSEEKLTHLCEVIGYTALQDFCQSFVIIVGSGGNGKNSLFDGCFTSFVRPTPTANSLDDIENDNFITGTMFNHYQNIFLESSPKTYTDCKMLKQVTGSTFQTINDKGDKKFTSYMNCKQIHAANDQDKIKFSDTTDGFMRRANFLEVWFHWDKDKFFMRKGDYYDTTFSNDLHEIKSDVANSIIFAYFAMFGIKSATKNFTSQFAFTYNDWKQKYTDTDLSLKEKIESVSINDILQYIQNYKEDAKSMLYDSIKCRLYNSPSMKLFGVTTFDKMVSFLDDAESRSAYFAENEIYIGVRYLQFIIGDKRAPGVFTQALKKVFFLRDFMYVTGNKPVVKVTFVGKRLKIIA